MAFSQIVLVVEHSPGELRIVFPSRRIPFHHTGLVWGWHDVGGLFGLKIRDRGWVHGGVVRFGWSGPDWGSFRDVVFHFCGVFGADWWGDEFSGALLWGESWGRLGFLFSFVNIIRFDNDDF